VEQQRLVPYGALGWSLLLQQLVVGLVRETSIEMALQSCWEIVLSYSVVIGIGGWVLS